MNPMLLVQIRVGGFVCVLLACFVVHLDCIVLFWLLGPFYCFNIFLS